MSDNTTMLRRVGPAGRISLLAVVGACLSPLSCVSKKMPTDSSQGGSVNPALDSLHKTIINGGPVLARAEAGQGLLWFPFVWSPILGGLDKSSGVNAVDTLYFQQPRLVLKNSATKAEILVDLREENGSENRRFQISQSEPQKMLRFYFPRFIALSQGDYTIEGIRTEISTSAQERGTLVSMPFVNPFQSASAKPLQLKIREGRVAMVARVVQTTSIAETVQGLSLKTTSENLDSDVVPVGLVLKQLGKYSADALATLATASDDFPRTRLDLTDLTGNTVQFGDQVARVGFVVDAPCESKGSVRLVWKRQNDDREYLTQFPITEAKTDCKDKHSFGFKFTVPAGDWVLKSTMLSPAGTFQPQIQTSWLKSPSLLLKEYFSLEEPQFQWTMETHKEREIRKALVIPVDSASRRFAELRRSKDVYRANSLSQNSDILFLGHFDIRTSEAKNDKVAIWDFVLKSSFDLTRAQDLLGAKDVFNAYTLERLNYGRSNNASIVLRTAADKDDRPSVAPVAAELQGEAKKAYSSCVKEREETDPLVNLAGLLQFTVLKGSDSVNLKSQRASGDAIVENWLELCMKKKFIGFRFSRKAPVNFQGELKFGKEN
ncbi:MAG: hypothetical protein ACO3A4_03705 [Silvanigrellaceae bacterium]